MFKKVERIHFIGIGGAGMSGIAEVLFNLGYKVTGSDIAESPVTRRLKSLGIKVHLGHRGSQVGSCHVVVTSSAIPPNNPEIRAATTAKIPVISRAVMLAELMRMKEGIAIAGTHGKTTTTAMVARVLARGGLDPTFVIGGVLNRIGSSAKLGRGDFLVAEADESDGSFLHLSPAMAVVTSVDKDHLDYYGTLSRMKQTFLEFINKVPFYGLAILCTDDKNVRGLLPRVEKRYLTYGLKGPAELRAQEIRRTKKGLVEFNVFYRQKNLGRITLGLPGIHNVQNSLAAIGVGLELGINFANIRKALRDLKGVERRLEIKGVKKSILVIDDYAHHPTEVKAVLATVRGRYPERRLIGIFQPHRYTRTRDLLKDFAAAFKGLDILILTRIYPAGEKPIPGVKTRNLLPLMAKKKRPCVKYIASLKTIVKHLLKILEPNDLVLTLGAGDVHWVGEELLRKMKNGKCPPKARFARSARRARSRLSEADKIKSKIRKKIQKIVKGEVRFDEPMSRHTSFGIGGPADCLIIPQGAEDLKKIILFGRKRGLPLKVMGQGTNLLVRDRGIRGIGVKLGKGFEGIKFSEDHLLAGAAVRLSTLIKLAAARGLGGLEFAVGIPGSLGGAIATNAGTGGLSISQRLMSIRIMSGKGRIKDLRANDLNFGYRRCPLGKDSIILDARLKLERAEEEEIPKRMNTFLKKREKTQPLGTANAGCVFKNPDPRTPAARLIEEAGLKGKRIGKAMVSKVHANFILNLGKAKAEDVLALMEVIKEEVKRKTGIELESEIEVWGEN